MAEVAGLMQNVTLDGETIEVVSFDIRTEPIRIVSNIPEMDPGWVHKDVNGHWHYIQWSNATPAQAIVYRTPTMEDRCTLGGHPHEDDTDDCVFGWFCKKCGERLYPRTRIPHPSVIAGPTTFILDIDKDVWNKRFGTPAVVATILNEEHILTLRTGSLVVRVVSIGPYLIRLEG